MVGAAADVVVIGGGLAGLLTALSLAPMRVTLLAAAPLGQGAASAWAQGGVAAAIGDDDSAELHLQDTLAAGDGLCDHAASARILGAGREAIEELCRRGVRFDCTDAGFALGLEAAHARRRILHADGDGTGREIIRALEAAVRACPSITVLEAVAARRLLLRDSAVQGVLADAGGVLILPSRAVVLASGGAGALFRHTTNPAGAWGSGLALAARAGAVLADLEFVQFHPTALDAALDPMPLVSEAVRGEGALLVDETGDAFMQGRDLAPRDVVARAVAEHLSLGHRVFLDSRSCLGARFAARFPAIAAFCAAQGIDPARMPIPVRPAAHYHMGGVAVDAAGRSSVAGLWACGEVASTGLHGANRLASNSLLEAAVCAGKVADDLRGLSLPRARPAPLALPQEANLALVRPIVSAALGIGRDEAGLHVAIPALLDLVEQDGPESDPALVGLMMATAALQRRESRGAHMRRDYPDRDAAWQRSQRVTLDGVLADARAITGTTHREKTRLRA